jgi:hypothetical protein
MPNESIWYCWKAAQILFETTFCLTFEITLMFWIFLFQTTLPQMKEEMGDLGVMVVAFDHIAPVSFHIADWLMQRQRFDCRHYPIPFAIYLSYAIFNIVATLATGDVIYSI